MPEATSTCQIHKKHSLIECANPGLPGDPEGLCIIHSHDKAKDPEAFKEALRARWEQIDTKFYNFRGVYFPGPFDPEDFFGSRKFPKPVSFSGAIFTERVNFSWATFAEWVNFSGATFKKAVFYRATFSERSIFTGAIFTERANFTGATFSERANFTGAIFTGRANFTGATFTEAIFTGATFTEEANFTGAAIGARVVFRAINPRDKAGRAPPFIGDFSRLEFQDRGVLRFQNLSLAYCKFEDSDLRQVEFNHVQWHPYRSCQAIYDEVLLRQRELSFVKRLLSLIGIVSAPDRPTMDDYGEVERLYRNLEVNYETENDYKSSGDFHYGEMEMHRRASRWRWFPFYWYNLYWLSSGYGERPLRAVLTLAGLLLAFSVFLLGLEKSLVPGGWSWAGFCQSFLYVFQQGTLQKPELLKPATNGGKFLSAVMPVLIPGQAALFLLALRNRLGRRR